MTRFTYTYYILNENEFHTFYINGVNQLCLIITLSKICFLIFTYLIIIVLIVSLLIRRAIFLLFICE